MTVAYIAFQYETATSGSSWNDLLDETASGTIADITDENNVSTGWDLSVDTGADGAFDAGVNTAGSGDALWVDEAAISYDYHYVDTATAVFSINGLDNSKTYDIEVYGSRAGTGTRRTEFSYDGFTTIHGTENWYGNNSATVTMADISPSTGTITISWRKLSGDAYGYLNAVKITENAASGAITYLGKEKIDASAGDDSTTVTIPAGATVAVIHSSWWDQTQGGSDLATVTIDSQLATNEIQADATATQRGVLLASATGFSTGASKTVSWTYDTDTAVFEGGAIYITWWSGVDTTTPFSDSDYDRQTTAACQGSVTTADNEVVVVQTQKYTSVNKTELTVSGSPSITPLYNDDTVNSHEVDLDYFTRNQTTHTLDMSNEYYCSITAGVLKVGATTIPIFMNSYRQRRT